MYRQCEDARCDRLIQAPWFVIIAGRVGCSNSLGGDEELGIKMDTD